MTELELTSNDEVREFWERQPCGTGKEITSNLVKGSKEWFECVEAHRYKVEPFIHSIAQFTRHRGEKILEVGVGAGTDHLQWARAGCECYGVDLTEAAIETTRSHLSHYGLKSNLQKVDAEQLPFDNESFDVVYSWGVIHHAKNPEKIIREIRRILKPNGLFIGMIYGLYSPLVFKEWVRNALLKGQPWRSFSSIVWHDIESIGTKAYTFKQTKKLFHSFKEVQIKRIITTYDTDKWPKWFSEFFPNKWGWFITIRAFK